MKVFEGKMWNPWEAVQLFRLFLLYIVKKK